MDVDVADIMKTCPRSVRIDFHAIERAQEHGCKYELCYEHIELLLESEHKCYWCGEHMKHHERTIDHVIPISRGGPHVPRNLVVAHRDCNQEKADMMKMEYTIKKARKLAMKEK